MLLTTPNELKAAVARVKLAADPKSSFATNAGIRFYVAGDASETYLEAATYGDACRRHVQNDAMNMGALDAVVHVREVEKALKVFAKADELAVRANDDGVVFYDGDRGRRKLHSPVLPREEWPNVDFSKGRQLLSGVDVREPLLRALKFASKDDTRPQLCAVSLDLHPNEGAHFVASDSYRLLIARTGGHPAGVLAQEAHSLPSSVLARIAKGLKGSAEFYLYAPDTGTRYVASIDDGVEEWSFAPVDGKFPNWRQLVPECAPKATLTVARSALVSAVQAAQIVATANTPLRMNVNGAVTVKVNHPDASSFEEELAGANVRYHGYDAECEHAGDGVDYGYNPDFMLDCVRETGTDTEIAIQLLSPLRPALVTADDDRALLMPIRLNV